MLTSAESLQNVLLHLCSVIFQALLVSASFLSLHGWCLAPPYPVRAHVYVPELPVTEAAGCFLPSRTLTLKSAVGHSRFPQTFNASYVPFPGKRLFDAAPLRYNTTTYIYWGGSAPKPTAVWGFTLFSSLPSPSSGSTPHHSSVSGLFQEKQRHVTALLFPSSSLQQDTCFIWGTLSA